MAQKYYGYVSIPHSTYNEWRNATNGNGYDADYAYGCQCMDLAAEFWWNVGFPTGYPVSTTGNADGVWARRNDNLSYGGSTKFRLITSLNDVKRGDVLCYSISPFGHIGFADEDYSTWHAANPGSYEFPILSENNGGTPDPAGGAWTNVHGYDTRYFQGAFRYIPWESGPTPTPGAGIWKPKKQKFPWVLVSRKLREQRSGNGL